jgi:hypothetical protein
MSVIGLEILQKEQLLEDFICSANPLKLGLSLIMLILPRERVMSFVLTTAAFPKHIVFSL